MNFYSNPETRKRANEEARKQQRQAELDRQERVRQSMDRTSLKSIRAQEKAEQDALREAAQQRIVALQAEQEQLLRETRKVERKRLTSEFDNERVLGDAPATMSRAEGDVYNLAQFNLFVEQTPDYVFDERNAAALSSYFERNHIQLISAEAFKAAWSKLKDAGIIVEPETPKPVAAQPTWYLIQDVDQDRMPPDTIVAGYDPRNPSQLCSMTLGQVKKLLENNPHGYRIFCRDAFKPKPAVKQNDGEFGIERGEEVWKSAWEVDQMTSDEYRKFARPRTNIDQLLVQPELRSDL
jgi:hypothetical protein